MSGFKEYEQYDALGLADLVRRKEVLPEELLEAAIERVEARNPAINPAASPATNLTRESSGGVWRVKT